jgi:hypothetical protein
MKKSAIAALLALAATPALADVRPGDHHESGEGVVFAGSFRGITNVRISGDAAKVLFRNMKDATETSHQYGSLTVVARSSRDIECVFEAAAVLNYDCTLHVDSRGQVEGGSVAHTQTTF